MKKIVIFLIPLIFSCSDKTTFEELVINQQELLLFANNTELKNIREDFSVNEMKYYLLHDITQDLNEILLRIKKQTSRNETDQKQLTEMVNEYFDFISSLEFEIVIQESIAQQKETLLIAIKRNTFKGIQKELWLNNIITLNTLLVRLIQDNFKREDFHFANIYPLVIEKANTVKKGETYSARIIMAGIDTTRVPIITINGLMINFENGEGKLEIPTANKGTYKWTGEVKWLHEATRTIRSFTIEEDFIVE